MIRFLTFDCYGTLVDWRQGIETNFDHFFRSVNDIPIRARGDIFERYVSLEAQEEIGDSGYRSYKEVLDETSVKLAKNLGLQVSGDSGKKFAESITKWPAFPDTVVALKELGRLGMSRAILSNIDRDLLKETIRNNELEVDDFITAQDVRSYKPSKGHWVEFFRRSGAKKEDVVHVAGSIYHDIVPAKEIGLKTIWVNRYGEKEPTTKPDHTVKNLSEVVKLFEDKKLA